MDPKAKKGEKEEKKPAKKRGHVFDGKMHQIAYAYRSKEQKVNAAKVDTDEANQDNEGNDKNGAKGKKGGAKTAALKTKAESPPKKAIQWQEPVTRDDFKDNKDEDVVAPKPSRKRKAPSPPPQQLAKRKTTSRAAAVASSTSATETAARPAPIPRNTVLPASRLGSSEKASPKKSPKKSSPAKKGGKKDGGEK